MGDLMETAERVEADPQSACDKLSTIEGCRVQFKDGEYQFHKWGDEFFCATPEQVAAALRARASSPAERR